MHHLGQSADKENDRDPRPLVLDEQLNDRCANGDDEHKSEHNGKADTRIDKVVARFFVYVLSRVFHDGQSLPVIITIVYPTCRVIVKQAKSDKIASDLRAHISVTLILGMSLALWYTS